MQMHSKRSFLCPVGAVASSLLRTLTLAGLMNETRDLTCHHENVSLLRRLLDRSLSSVPVDCVNVRIDLCSLCLTVSQCGE